MNTGTPKPINEIEFPEYAGALSHNFFEEGIKGAKLMDFIKANPAIKEALEANNIDWSNISLEVDDSALTNTRIDPVHGPQIHSVTYGPNREERAADILIRLKYNNKESKPIKLKGIYYKSPYAVHATDGGENPSNHTNHNGGKLVVDDPDHISLTSDQKEKLINDFLKANTKLGLDKSQLSMADDGNLTITSKPDDPNHWTTVVPKTQFISVIAKVPDVIVFKDPKNSGSIPLTHPVVVDLMDGEHILNARGNNAIQANQKKAKDELNGMTLDQKDGKLIISGKLDREDGGTGRYLKVWSGDQIPDKKYGPDDKDYNYLSSWSNLFKIRQLFPNGSTIIRCVDQTPNHVTKEEFDNSLDIGLRPLRFGGDNGVDMKKLKEDINKNLKREWDKGSEYSDLKHEVGTRSFTGKLVTPEGNYSGEVTSTVIYYTEKLNSEILVKDPKNLNPEEKADIASKVKEASKLAPTDKVEIGPDGKVTITFIRGGKKLGTKSFKPSLVIAKYEPQEELVRENEDKTIKAPIKGTKAGKDFTFPEGSKFELPKDAPAGVTLDPKTGEISYKVPKNNQEISLEGSVNVQLPGENHITKVPYKINVQRPSYAKVRYVTSDGKDIDPKFRAEAEDKYPSEIEGKRDAQVIEYTEKKDFVAPKFVGYTFERPQVNGQNQSFNPQKNATLELVYRKIDDIIPADSGQGKPDGYVEVTFKDVEGGKLDQADADKVYFVNPKAGVKISESKDGANLVGKDKNGKEQKVALPKVSPDEKYKVNYHKPSANETTTWAYDKYDQVGKEITEDKEFTAQVVKQQKEEFEPKYKDTSGIPGQEAKVGKPNFTDKDGQKVDEPKDAKYTAPDKDAKDLPKGVTVKEDGTLTVKVPNGAKDGSDIEVPVTVNPDGSLDVKVPENAKDGIEVKVPVKVTYPDGTSDTVDAKVTVVDQSQKVEPAYTPETAKPGETKKVAKPSFTDKDGQKVDEPKDAKYTAPDKDAKDLPKGVTVKEDGTLTVKVPNGAKDGSDIEVPVTVNPDGSLDVKIPENAKDGIEVKVPVKVTYPDGTSDTVDAKVTVVDQSQKVEPKYGDKTGTPGQEVPVEKPNFTDKEGKKITAPAGTKYELGKDAPQGVTVNPDGSLTVKVPEGAKDGDVITVPVKVTYPDGTTDTVNAKVTVVDQSQKVEPKYEGKTGTPGKEAKVDKPNFTDKGGNPTTAPDGTTYELGKDAPQGVTVNPDGSLTVKVPEGAKDGDVITVPVKVTYPDGTTDTVEAKVTVVDQSQKVEPKYDDKTGTPGQEVPVEKPNFTDKDNKPTKVPEGTTYELGKDAPQGVTVNPDGSLTVKVPEGAKDGDVITVPVKVTYPDGTTDTVEAKVTVVDQSQKVEPKYGDKTGTPGQEAKVEKPNFTDKDGNPTTAPDGTKYELGKDAPQGVTVKPDGSLTVKVPEGAKDGDVITVPVKVTYPDGTTDTVNAKVTVVDQSQKVEPKYGEKTGTPGQKVPVEKPTFTDKDGKKTPVPEGTKYELGKDAPQGVTVNPDGSLTVKVPEGAKDGDVITVPVKVTYPDGTSDTVNAKVTVSDQSQTVEPKYKDKVGTPGSSVKVDQPEFTGKDGKTTPAPEGTKYELGKDAPQGVTVKPDGSLTVKVPEGAKDGDVITVPVKVTYPDGTSDTVNAKVTVKAQSQTVEPKYKDQVGTPGSSVKVDQPEFTDKDGKTTPAPEGTKYELGKDAPQGVTVKPDGSLTVKVPEGAKDGDVITVPVTVTYPDGTTDTVEAKVTVSDHSQKYTPKPVITLVDDLNKITKEEQDQAVKSLKDFNKDLPKDTVITIDKDGNAVFTYPDGTTDLIEKAKVFAERETTLPPVFDKVKEGDKQISGKTEAFAKVIVTIPGLDKPVEVTADEDGNFLVPVPDGVTLKAKDKITAIAQGKDKKVSKVGQVIVEEIPTSPLPCPSSPEPATPSPEPSHPSAPQVEDNDHPSQESDHIQQPSQPTVTDHSQQATTDQSIETSAKEDTQTAATASPKLSRVEEKETQTEKAAQTENANTSLPKTGVVAAPVALELLLVAAGAILALPSKRKNK
ncbi:YPDG domain-containing protein [Aerococcus sp. JJEM-2022c]|nr:YPDG domain-containing protein [Aerococcus sp. Group 2]MCY3041628.1 YPDG domain-containing protein [Aerococcus sp. Group 2]